jgi:DNA-binding transcriptional MocR family regulator
VGFWDNFKVDRPGPKFRAIYSALEEAIEQGRLQPGKRLPSHRLLADKLGVAVGTVTRAYAEALEHGLITGEVGRGSYVREHAPAPLAVAGSSRIPAGSLDLYQNFPVPIHEFENKIWSETLEQLSRRPDIAQAVRSSWSELNERSQQTGARWIGRTGLVAPAKQIVDCPGVQAALSSIVTAVTEPGNLVLTAALSHPGIKLLADQHSLKIQGIAMDDEGMDPAALEVACQDPSPKVIYCAPTVHSPTTKTLSVGRRKAIAKLAEKYDCLIIEDESAAFLLPDPPPPISSFAPDHSFFIGDVWLALSLGIRTSYVLVPERMMRTMDAAVAGVSGLTTPLVAEIASMWIQSDIADQIIEQRRIELSARNALARQILSGRTFHAHPYGHNIWLELPRPWSSEGFVLRAEKAGIAINSAEWFAIDHGSIPEAVRICIGNAPGRPELRWALESMQALLDESRAVARPAM